MRYAPSPSFSYLIPLANGSYTVALTFVEPDKTGPGQRLFAFAVNLLQYAEIDVFARVGLLKALTATVSQTVTAGTLELDFSAAIGRAVVSRIVITPAAILPSLGSTLVLDSWPH